MQLNFHREFASPARIAWTYLCDPERMSRWSAARVQLRSAGQSGHPGGPGAHRRVTVQALGRSVVLDEVIRDASPPEYLRYQVVDAVGLRSHTGQIFITDRGERCSMHWQVDFEFNSRPATALVARVLQKQLGDSLDTLARLLLDAQHEEIALPRWSEVAPPAEQDWQQAEEVLSALQSMATELSERGDPKNIFAHVYGYVSEGIITGAKNGEFIYPAWALKLLPSFHGYYLRNYERWCGLAEGPVESHWQRAFQVTDHGSSRYPGPDGQLVSGLILSIHAHVEADLPRSLAEVYADSFADTSDYNRFRGDYYSMGKIFEKATTQITPHIPPEFVPLWATTLQRVISDDMVQRLIYRRSYDLLKRRRAAFRKGAEIAEMLTRRQRA